MAKDAYSKARLLFAAALCAGGTGGAAWYAWSSAQYTTYRIETHDPVSGLIAGSPVEYHGVEVGKVTKIRLLDPDTVGILLRVASDAPVSKATVATITARGLAARGFAGYVYVALESRGTDPGPLAIDPGQRYATIPAGPKRSETMDAAVADAAGKVQILTRLLQSLLDDRTIASLKKSVDGLQEITASLAANNERMISLLANAERDSREVRPVLEASNTTLRELRSMLPQFYRAIADLDGVARAMSGVANRVARDPSALLRGTATPPGPGER